MKTNVMMQLVWKDWRLQRRTAFLTMLAGSLALTVCVVGGQLPVVIGAVFFFVAMIFGACLIPMQNIVNERKKQNLPFIMSLPVSSARYGIAKLISSVGMFVVVWLVLIAVGIYMILVRHILPVGTIPMSLVLVNFPLIGFCLTTGAALVSESEAGATAAIAVVNSSYWLVWFLLVNHFPSLTKTWTGSVAVWSPLVFKILGVEFAVVVVILGMTLYLQSRKRNFI